MLGVGDTGSIVLRMSNGVKTEMVVIVAAGARLPQGDGSADSPGRLQGQQAAEEDQKGPQAPLLGRDLPG